MWYFIAFIKSCVNIKLLDIAFEIAKTHMWTLVLLDVI